MQYNKLYQYKDINKESAVVYSGTLALVLLDDSMYNVNTPVNKTTNAEINETKIIEEDTLSNQGD